MDGFITDDGYAAVPCGKALMIIYNGQQLELVTTVRRAHNFIKQHRTNPETGTVFVK